MSVSTLQHRQGNQFAWGSIVVVSVGRPRGFLLKMGRCRTALDTWLNLPWQLGSGFVSGLAAFQLKNDRILPDISQLTVSLAETQESKTWFPLPGVLFLLAKLVGIL